VVGNLSGFLMGGLVSWEVKWMQSGNERARRAR